MILQKPAAAYFLILKLLLDFAVRKFLVIYKPTLVIVKILRWNLGKFNLIEANTLKKPVGFELKFPKLKEKTR